MFVENLLCVKEENKAIILQENDPNNQYIQVIVTLDCALTCYMYHDNQHALASLEGYYVLVLFIKG